MQLGGEGGETLNVLWWCVSKGLGFTLRQDGHSKGAMAEGKHMVRGQLSQVCGVT